MKLKMDLDNRSYDIIIKRGGLESAGQMADLNRKVLVVSDEGVPTSYVETIMQQCGNAFSIVFPSGEQTKSIASWQAILSKMLAHGFTRSDAVAAVGGGVVGDLAGFAAAAYMRGISFYNFPTTTLSQIDSSIGGKVAVNLDKTKNTIGAFHQPKMVIIDPDTLRSLNSRQYSNGLAEAIKTALIGDEELFLLMENEPDLNKSIEAVLYYCLQYKKMVVERDETEQGERKLLNFGHTIGHGIEAAGFEQESGGLLHGECVALGMLPMIESHTLAKRTKAIMQKLNLPLSHTANPKKVLEYIKNDKKRKEDVYTIVRVKTIGHGYLEDVSFEEIEHMVLNMGGS